MTYFRMRMHTIIGATSFHGPVRDGKGWIQSAMTAKRNFIMANDQTMNTGCPIASHSLEEVKLGDCIWANTLPGILADEGLIYALLPSTLHALLKVIGSSRTVN